MKIDLSNYELYNLLENGSTNQKHFISQINNFCLNPDDVFETMENMFDDCELENYDVRGWINGGVLYISDIVNDDFLCYEIDNGVYLILE